MAIRKVSLQSDLRDAVLPSAWVESQDCVQFIRNALRRAFSRTRCYSSARNTVRREITVANRRRIQYSCNHCNKWFFRADTQVDHIQPVEDVAHEMVRADGKFDWNRFIDRLFTTNLQVLCKSCHSAKSTTENAHRKAMKKANKLAKVGQYDRGTK